MNNNKNFTEIMRRASYICERKYLTNNNEIDKEELEYWKKILFEKFFDNIENNAYAISLANNKYRVKTSFDYLYPIFDKILNFDSATHSTNFKNIMFGTYYERVIEVAVKILLEKWNVNISFQMPIKLLDSFRENLIHRLSYMSNRSLIQEMHILKKCNGLNGGSPLEEYKDFDRSYLSTSEYIYKFFNIYPVLLRNTLEQIWMMVSNFVEVFQRLFADKEIIEKEIFHGEKFSNVKSVKFGKSDFHNGGKTVYTILLDNEKELVYKSHSLLCEKYHNKLFKYLLQKTGFDCFEYKIIDRESYGWEEYIIPIECNGEDQLCRYYTRFGILIFLNYILHSGDLHYENLLAVGEYPVLIDCETILCNQRHIIRQDTAISKIQEELSESILFSGLLPHYITGEKEKISVNVSAISGVGGQELPIKIPKIIEPFSSNARIEYINPKTVSNSNLPKYNQESILPKEYLSKIQKGFSDVYKYVLNNKSEFLNKCSDYTSIKLRFLFRNTQQYSMLLNLSYHPDFLQNGRDRELLMGVLYKQVNIKSFTEKSIVEMESLDLLNGDIPYFGFFSDELDLLHRLEKIENFYLQSSVDNYKKNIRSLSENDLQRQQLYLNLLFTKYSLPGFNKVTEIVPKKAKYKDHVVYIDAAHEVGKHLLDKAKYNNEKTDVNWLEITVEGSENGIWSFEPLDMYLYNGLAGILIFLVSLKKCSLDPRYDELINLLKNKYFEYTDEFNFENIKTNCNGAFFGESSILYMYELLYSITGNEAFYNYAQRHSSIVDKLIKEIELDKNYDILLGSAGCILVYLNMFSLKKEAIFLQRAINIGELLLCKKDVINDGYAWTSVHEDVPLTGFSHGACGMAYTFMKLWDYTGNDRYLDASKKILLYENSQFEEKLSVWRDLRKIRKKRKDTYTSAAWCHGSAGILLGRMRMYQTAPTELKSLLERDCKRALKDVLKSGSFINNCLCHGNAGNLEILTEYTKIFGDRHLDFVEDGFYVLADKVKKKEWNCQLPQAYENPGFMIGISGIGYSLLRQFNKDLPEIISVSV